MILSRLTAKPFAGLADRTLEFRPGLNVLVGPNEAGKSTVLAALDSLLAPDPPERAAKARFEERFFPVTGGDTIGAGVEFTVGGEAYTLGRTWKRGAKKWQSAELVCGASRWTGDEAVAEKLVALLPATTGALRHALLAGQAALADSIEELAAAGVPADLAALAAVDDGTVSAAAFLARLREEHEKSFGRWDPAAGRPEDGRGIDNPWQNGVRAVCRAWYAMETARRDLAAVTALETRLDTLTAELTETGRRIAGLEGWIAGRRAAYDDASRRAVLVAELAGVDLVLQAARDTNAAWPVADKEAAAGAAEVARLDAEITRTEAAAGLAQAWEAAGQARTRLEEARRRAQAVAEAEAAVAALPAAAPEALAELERITGRLPVVDAQLAGARLVARLEARGQVEVAIRGAGPADGVLCLAAGESRELAADGRIAFDIGDLSVEVVSGAEDVAALLAERDGLAAARDAALAAAGVGGIDELRERRGALERAGQVLEGARRELAAALAPHRDLAALEAEVAAAGPTAAPPRAHADELRALGALRETRATAAARAEQAAAKAAGFVNTYGSLDGLLDSMVDAKGRRAAFETELGGLAALPDGEEDAAAFRRAYDTTVAELDQAKARQADLRVDAKEAATTLGERTAEELAPVVAAAEASFRRELARGEAVARVLAVAEQLAENEVPRTAWVAKAVGGHLAALTGGKYTGVAASGGDDTLPDAVALSGGVALPFDLLSAGTKDCFALALRLALAERFLAGKGGFVVLDDPFVDLDKGRREAAAKALAAFAETTQVIVLTCHEEHAALLGGHRIAV